MLNKGFRLLKECCAVPKQRSRRDYISHGREGYHFAKTLSQERAR